MKTCDTCKFWNVDPLTYIPQDSHRLCSHRKIDGTRDDDDTLNSNADYDYGVTTGPKFGCIYHEEK